MSGRPTACTVDDCERAHYSRGLCRTHYKRWLAHGDEFDRSPARPYVSGGTCVVDGCSKRRHAHSMCRAHLGRLQRWGDASLGLVLTPAIERLLRRVVIDPETGCWVWHGALQPNGYGTIGRGGKTAGNSLTHQVTYRHFVGPVPDGLDLDHLCRNRACCNPDHLEPVTRSENIRRGLQGVLRPPRTHCRNGHATTANRCPECRAAAYQRARARAA